MGMGMGIKKRKGVYWVSLKTKEKSKEGGAEDNKWVDGGPGGRERAFLCWQREAVSRESPGASFDRNRLLGGRNWEQEETERPAGCWGVSYLFGGEGGKGRGRVAADWGRQRQGGGARMNQ